jgi:hypothetical protein
MSDFTVNMPAGVIGFITAMPFRVVAWAYPVPVSWAELCLRGPCELVPTKVLHYAHEQN